MKRLLLILALLLPIEAFATTYWVGKSGSDANSCMTASGATDPGAANRKLTINAGISCMSGGDTVQIGDGTYDEYIRDTVSTNIPSGTEGSPTIIRAENIPVCNPRSCAPTAIISPTVDQPGYGTITIIDKDWITVKGLEIEAEVNTGNGTFYAIGLSDILLETNAFDGNPSIQGECATGAAQVGISWGNGVTVGVNLSQRMTIRNNYFSGWGYVCDDSAGGPVPTGGAMYVSGPDNLIEDNIFENMGNYAAQNRCSGCSEMNNNIYRRNYVVSVTNGNYPWYMAGANTQFYNNITGPFTPYSGQSDASVVTGQVGEACENCLIANNTLVDGIRIYPTGPASTVTVTNNIRSFYTDGQGGNTEATGFTYDAGVFVDAAGGDFNLAGATSPPYNAGTTLGAVTTDFAGVPRPNPPATNYAIGAFELTDTPAATPPTDSFVYAIGSDLSGNNGGTGWTGSWSCDVASSVFVQTAPSGFPSAGTAARSQYTGGDGQCTRGFTALSFATTQTLTVYMNVSDCSPSIQITSVRISLDGAAASGFYIRPQSGLWQLQEGNSGSSWVTAGACSANTTTRIDFQANDTAQPNKYRVAINGVYSSYYDVVGTNLTTLNTFHLRDANTSAHTTWWGDIGVDAQVATKLLWISQPSSGAVNTSLGAVSVGVYDADSVLVTTATNAITIANKGGTCTGMTLTQSPTSPISATAGVSSWSSIAENATGACTLTATASGLTSADSSAFTVTAAPTPLPETAGKRLRR